MNYKKLKNAHTKYKKLEPRYFFYDGYMKTKGDFWFRNGKVNEHEIKKLRYFIRSWDPHFSGSVNKLNGCFKKIHRDIMVLKNRSIDRINLSNEKTKKRIERIFNSFAKCSKRRRFESTDASKIIHAILPKLFVMWDRRIRDGIWKKQKQDGWERPRNNKFTGREYAYCFLPLMQEEAKNVINSYTNEHPCDPKYAINGISKEGSNYTLAKLLDEYNYVKYTKKDP